jgi:hypothetical protein
MPDVLGSLTGEPAELDIAGTLYEIPWRTAAEWLAVLDQGRVHSVAVKLMGPEDRENVLMALVDGELGQKDLADASYKLMKEVTGWSWWECYRLATLPTDPSILGRLTLAGVRAREVSLVEWCAAVYALCTKDAKAEDVFKFDAMLAAPPPGFEDDWEDEQSFDDMVRAARAMPGVR